MDYIVAKNLESTGIVKTIFTKKGSGDFFYNDEKSYEDFERLGKIFNISSSRMIRIFQCHSNKIMIVENKDAGLGIDRPEKEKQYDGLITNKKNILLTTVEADCVPVLMLDPKNKVIANIHSGWRGTSKCIVVNAIKIMCDEFKTDTRDLLIFMGPSICKDCYEVSEDLIVEFRKTYTDSDINKIFIKKDNGKFLLDLKLAIRLKLELLGVKSENIEESNICTFEDKTFDSKRRDDNNDIKNGRMLSGIMLI